MPFPRTLPSLKSVEDDFRITALWLQRALYTGIFAYAVYGLFNIVANGPQMAEEQLPQWGSMPWLTLCLDNSTSSFVQSAGFIALGFGHKVVENALSGECTRDGISGDTDTSRWVSGTAVEATQGRCHKLDLSPFVPFSDGTPVNNMIIGGIAEYPGGLFPKFIAVGTSTATDPGIDSTFANPLVYLYPQRFLVDELGRPQRIDTPSYALDKEQVPLPDPSWWFSSKQKELFTVRNMGSWKSCVPMSFQKGIKAGQVVFGFGIFITSPTVKSVYSVGVLPRVLQMIGSIGGWCGIALLIWRCVFVRPHGVNWPSDEEKRTLHPALQGWHMEMQRAAKSLRGESPALEEPLVQ